MSTAWRETGTTPVDFIGFWTRPGGGLQGVAMAALPPLHPFPGDAARGPSEEADAHAASADRRGGQPSFCLAAFGP